MTPILKLLKRLLPYLLILLITLSFFLRLFFPVKGVYSTYESVYNNDLLGQHLAFKEVLSRALKSGTIPFWSADVGTGFPLFAESSVGTFNFFNLLLFYLFDAWLAFNLSYIFIFLTAYIGSYLFFRKIKISLPASLFSATAFTLGGSLAARLQHFNYLQAISFIPWIFLLSVLIWEKKSYLYILVLSIIFSQQIFVGGLQWMVIALMGVALMLMMKVIYGEKEKLLPKIARISVCVILPILISMPQLLSTYEMQSVSARSLSLNDSDIYLFSFNPKRLVTFLFPDYYHGSPKELLNPFDSLSGLYWEESVYIGILPLVFLFVALVKKKKKPWEITFLVVLIFSFLVSLGKFTFIGNVLSVPGLNYFRVPSRFLVLTTFSIALIAGYGLDWTINYFLGKIKNPVKRGPGIITIFIFIVLLFQIVELRRVYIDYYPVIPLKEYLSEPESATIIGDGDRFYTKIDNVQRVYDSYFSQESRNENKEFDYMKNGLEANLNLIYAKDQVKVYSGLLTKRSELQNSLVDLLSNAAGAKYIISTSELDYKNLDMVKKLNFAIDYLPPYFIYKNNYALDRFRLVSNFEVKDNLDQAVKRVEEGNFPFETSVILESNIDDQFSDLVTKDIELVKETDNFLQLFVNTDKSAILVLADSYYPSWKASVNGNEVKILPANINQRAIILPPGKNDVIFWYSKDKFHLGVKISAIAGIIFLIIWSVDLFVMKKSTVKKKK